MKKSLKFIPFLIYLVLRFAYYLTSNSRHARKITFDKLSKSKEFMMYSNRYNFLLFSRDYMISRSTYVDGPYDFYILKKALKLLPKKFVRETLVDVGANIGTISIPAIKDGLFKKSIAFEPNSKIYNILKINIFLNNLNKKITPLDFCLSSKNYDNLSFKMSHTNYGDTRFIKNNKNNLFSKNKVKKLDSFIKLFNPHKTLIKIDVQGFEPEVLLGSKLLLSFKPPIILEVDPIIINKDNFMKMLNIIKKNYTIFFDLNETNPIKNNVNHLENLFFKLKKSRKLSNILIIE